jgi:hypothetical protein
MHRRSKLLNLSVDASPRKLRSFECQTLNQPTHFKGKCTEFTTIGPVLAREASKPVLTVSRHPSSRGAEIHSRRPRDCVERLLLFQVRLKQMKAGQSLFSRGLRHLKEPLHVRSMTDNYALL